MQGMTTPPGSAAITGNLGECLAISADGANDAIVLQMTDRAFTGCNNNGIQVLLGPEAAEMLLQTKRQTCASDPLPGNEGLVSASLGDLPEMRGQR
jgi:hypothetical protein